MKFDTSSQLIILKDAVKIEMRDLKNLFICWQSGWRLVAAHDISPALLDGCGFHGLQNISGQTVSPSPLTQRAHYCLSALCFQLRHGKYCKGKNCIKAFHLYTHTCLSARSGLGFVHCRPTSQSRTSKLYCGVSLLEVQKLLHQNPTQLH